MSLQCGHDFSVMESWLLHTTSRLRESRCNVAMTFQSWKVLVGSQRSNGVFELQCGHDFSVMERLSGHPAAFASSALQCGHDFSVMERAAN